ncbi:MAG: DNA translocase FtsK 4TM domain-containing protein [Lachnospiraceae bacterium]|nr:DNA translocase FtsK 4TM domain-containing protein [Lachnospiraceae bacterium]
MDDVILLAVLAFCILLYLSYFRLAGTVGSVISSLMFGIFGMISYLVPPALFFGVAFYLSNRGAKVATVKVCAAAVCVVTLCAMASLLFTSDILSLEVKYFYSTCQNRHSSGGFIGCFLAWLFLKCIGKVATWVLLIVLIIISVVLITEKSFFKGVKEGSETIYHSARDDMERARERRIERREIRREERLSQEEIPQEEGVRRTDKKFTGVMIDTSLKDESKQKMTDDMHEITEPDEEEEQDESYFSLKNDHQIHLSDEEDFVDDYDDEVIPKKTTAKKSTRSSNSIREITPKGSGGKEAPAHTDRDGYRFPPLSLLTKGKKSAGDSTAHLNATAAKLIETLQTFGVTATVTDISQGPTVTRYELEPEAGVKVSKIVGLADDIKLHMAATDIRIEAPIPGKAAVGIEIPNARHETVMFRDLIESDAFQNAESKISFAVGKDLAGQVVVTDIAKMPHLLIAGATGSGKSVCINTLIMSILYKARPDEVKLIMVDPKVVELSVYNNIPHLLIPVVTDPKKAAAALYWGVNEMEERYLKFAELGVRDLKGYNKKIGTDEGRMPQIVIIVDELADLMMVAPGEVEESICRLAQKARAAGIHLILATQRPSVDVITGTIKANMPSRVAFSVSSGIDSRTILDMTGAEKLLGKGDMLFYPQGFPKPARIQGAFISDTEVQNVVDDLISHNAKEVEYNKEIEEKLSTQISAQSGSSLAGEGMRDELYVEAGRYIIENDKASIGNLQRRFKIGFNRAARIMDQLAEDEVVSKSEGTKARQVLMSMDEFDVFVEESV